MPTAYERIYIAPVESERARRALPRLICLCGRDLAYIVSNPKPLGIMLYSAKAWRTRGGKRYANWVALEAAPDVLPEEFYDAANDAQAPHGVQVLEIEGQRRWSIRCVKRCPRTHTYTERAILAACKRAEGAGRPREVLISLDF